MSLYIYNIICAFALFAGAALLIGIVIDDFINIIDNVIDNDNCLKLKTVLSEIGSLIIAGLCVMIGMNILI